MSRPVLYYVRHGETDWNRAARLQGRRDTSLNAHGREQAICCGEILRAVFARNGQNPAALDYVASPLKRARETMEKWVGRVSGSFSRWLAGDATLGRSIWV